MSRKAGGRGGWRLFTQSGGVVVCFDVVREVVMARYKLEVERVMQRDVVDCLLGGLEAWEELWEICVPEARGRGFRTPIFLDDMQAAYPERAGGLRTWALKRWGRFKQRMRHLHEVSNPLEKALKDLANELSGEQSIPTRLRVKNSVAGPTGEAAVAAWRYRLDGTKRVWVHLALPAWVKLRFVKMDAYARPGKGIRPKEFLEETRLGHLRESSETMDAVRSNLSDDFVERAWSRADEGWPYGKVDRPKTTVGRIKGMSLSKARSGPGFLEDKDLGK